MDFRASYKVMDTFETQNIGPLTQKIRIAQLTLLPFLKNWPTSTTHNLVNIHHMRMNLDFLESLRCPLKPLIGFISFEASMFMYTSLRKDDFLLIFKMTYNVLDHISRMKHFLGKSYKRQSCRELNLHQNELWLRNLWWSMWKLCLVKVQLTSP